VESCSNSVFSLRQEVLVFVAAALRRRALHGGDLLDVVTSAPFLLLFQHRASSKARCLLGCLRWARAVICALLLRLWCLGGGV
jgi:hypothetical protein